MPDEAFDTVSEIRSWLESEPTPDEVREALELEENGPDRTTGKSALRQYLEETDDPGGDDETVEFRVQVPFGGNSPGDTLDLDPDSTEARRLRRDGRISLN